MNRPSKVAMALASLAILGGCATAGSMGDGAVPEGAKYVAMGSSFAAGAGIGPTKPGTPERCGRTVNNYASLLAEKLDLALNDQGCGGAKTEHLLAPWDELPAQIDAVDSATRLVTITVGGNDLNYIGNLFMASCENGRVIKAGEREITCVSPQAPSEEGYAEVQAALENLARRVKEKAPEARVIFVQYVALVPDELCPAVAISEADADLTREIGLRLAEVTRRAAQATESLLLPADEMSADHTACDPASWSNATTKDRSDGAPWHPNALGHRSIADALAVMLTSAG
ncbi:SGNH/GDSL hydrolase family protein [Croceicoccus gelatinilyticus]|uniref:SGNH/GDSL hydrolase family protein n=1 Tax=Croceicoccus gelatinilyticus TaxID=2835536 RepID=UPI001CED890B|nr:SGNH/GDSL hydrolase family protein [Croceicoccus gelatinilyticus]